MLIEVLYKPYYLILAFLVLIVISLISEFSKNILNEKTVNRIERKTTLSIINLVIAFPFTILLFILTSIYSYFFIFEYQVNRMTNNYSLKHYGEEVNIIQIVEWHRKKLVIIMIFPIIIPIVFIGDIGVLLVILMGMLIDTFWRGLINLYNQTITLFNNILNSV